MEKRRRRPETAQALVHLAFQVEAAIERVDPDWDGDVRVVLYQMVDTLNGLISDMVPIPHAASAEESDPAAAYGAAADGAVSESQGY